MLTAYFYHKTTGLPLTDPTVTVSVTLANMNNDTKVLDNVPMTASTSFPWAFRHTYAIDTEIDYMAYYSCSNSNYIASVDKLFIQARSIWGGGWFNLSGVTGSITNLSKQITKQISELPQLDINEIKSHIDIAKDQVITTIESIEQAEFVQEEKEAKKAIKLLTTLDKKVSSYIDSEMKDKEELGAISKEFTKLEMEDAKREKEKEMEHKKMMEEKEKMEKEEDDKLLSEIKSEFDKQDEQEKEEKRQELERELEEAKKEVTEIEKELKTL